MPKPKPADKTKAADAPEPKAASSTKGKAAKATPAKEDQTAETEVVEAASVNDLTASVSKYLLRSQKSEDEMDAKLSPFLRKQRKRLLALRDAMLDSMSGVAQDNLRARAEGSEASAFGMHQADAGSDAYDRDFALNLLSQEQDALYEIDEALKRIELGTYGTCEMSGKPINHERLEAIPFTRFTVECQSQLERQNKAQRVRQSVTSLFGLTDEESNETEEEEFTPENKEIEQYAFMARDIITLECTEAKAEGKPASRYVSTRNKKSPNTPGRLEKKKYNPFLKRHTLHRETR